LISPNVLLAGARLAVATRSSGDAPISQRLLAPLHAWRRQSRTREAEEEAAIRVKRAVPGFSLRDFSAQARADYATAIAAISARDERALKSLLSTAALSGVRAGWAAELDGGARRAPVTITHWDEAATGVVASGALAAPAVAGSVFANQLDDFVQVTLRAVTLQKWGAPGGGAAVTASAAAAPRRRIAEGATLPAWAAVEDAGSGLYYYWDRVSGRTTWALPREFTAAGPQLPFSLTTSGDQTKLADGEVRVTHHVTFEQCTRPSQRSGAWYIVSIS
jgi:hypothetical protein